MELVAADRGLDEHLVRELARDRFRRKRRRRCTEHGIEVRRDGVVQTRVAIPPGVRSGGDGETHDVGSRTPADRALVLGTPSLRFVGRTAPYLHDGRYATLEELLVRVDGTMGHTTHLSAGDRAALARYLETL